MMFSVGTKILPLGRRRKISFFRAEDGSNDSQKVRVFQRFLKKSRGPVSERLFAVFRVIVCGDEDDGKSEPGRFELFLEFETVHSRHFDIQNQASFCISISRDRVQKILSRGKGLNVESTRAQETAQAFANRGIVVDDEYFHRMRGHDFFLVAHDKGAEHSRQLDLSPIQKSIGPRSN